MGTESTGDHPTDDGSGRTPYAVEELAAEHPSSDAPSIALWSSVAFAAISLLVGLDLAADAVAGVAPRHLLLEGGALLVALAAVVALWRAGLRARRDVQALEGEVASWRAEAHRWREESRGLLEGLGAAMDQQFTQWRLSPAEREVALLIVKGLGFGEIARVRTTSERTVRQQSQAIYRKAGLSGRAELSAFFLEDLLLPGALSDLTRP